MVVVKSCVSDLDLASSGTLDLTPVRDSLAQLPNQTLDMQLLFENGMTSNWQLGRGPVEALNPLPSLANE